MKVAIIGAGIGGLAALNELSKYEADAHLYEASDKVGGRICTGVYDGIDVELGASYFHDIYNGFMKLVDDFKLKKKPCADEKVGFLKDGNIIPVPSFRNMSSIARMYMAGRRQEREGSKALKRYYDSPDVDFADTLKRFPKTEKAYNRPFSEFAGKLNPDVKRLLLDPVMRSVVLCDSSQMNGALGRAVMGSAISDLYTFEGGLQELPKAIARHERNRGRISLETPVTRIERIGKKYGIVTPKESKEYDFVIAAVPLSKIPGMLDGYKNDVEYLKGVRTIVRGAVKDKYGKVDTLFIGEGDSGVNCLGALGKNLYEVDSLVENPRLDDFFSNGYEIAELAVWKEGIPVIGKVDEIPSIDAGQNFYRPGDFALPCMEMSVLTGRKAALDIIHKL